MSYSHLCSFCHEDVDGLNVTIDKSNILCIECIPGIGDKPMYTPASSSVRICRKCFENNFFNIDTFPDIQECSECGKAFKLKSYCIRMYLNYNREFTGITKNYCLKCFSKMGDKEKYKDMGINFLWVYVWRANLICIWENKNIIR